MKKAPPWLLVLAGLMVGFPAVRLATAPAEKPGSSRPSAPSGSAGTAEAEPPCLGPRCEPVRVLGEFFGLPPGKVDPAAVTGAAGKAGYSLRFLVALVPAPPDPRLDQALEAVQRGFAQSGWLVDRVWLPWGAKREAGAPDAPGLLLFRQQWEDGTRELALVFLVGETPKAGIRKDAFREALDLIAELQPFAEDPSQGALVRILGPSFSGSAESLRVALASWRAREQDPAVLPARRALRFEAATGSATSSTLGETFEEMGVPFCRTVVPDEALHERVLGFLRDEMGWDLRRVALLTEADTAYGLSLLASEGSEEDEERRERIVMVRFPSHISELRNAAEAEKDKEKQEDAAAQLPTSRRVLGFDLTDAERPPDLVPTVSPLTARSNDLMLGNLLETLAREGIRYVGILATDVKDKLFLAEKVREIAPDVVLFTFDNDLLFAHPQHAETLDGMLVLTSAPLFTEGTPWLPASLRAGEGRERRQFTSELQQGNYEAVRYLLGTNTVTQPQAWIAAVGNGSLWPVARLPVREGLEGLCGRRAPPTGAAADQGTGFSGKDDLQILLAAVILCLLSVWMRRVALLEPVAGEPVDPVPGNRRLLTLGSALLASAAGVLLAVSSVPLWARGLSLDRREVSWEPTQVLYLSALAFAYAFLVHQTIRAARGRARRAEWAAGALGGLLLLAVLAMGVHRLCIPGDQVEFFHLRARALSSGLSPLLSLAALGGAVCAWLLNELVRRRLMARLATDCPLPSLCEPPVAGCGPVLDSLRGLLTRTLPGGLRAWLLPAVALVPPATLLWGTVQPIAETRGYGRFFVVFLIVAVALAALSFSRFARLWLGVHQILRRLDHASPELAAAFSAVGKELNWRPIKSFGWRIPPFTTLILSVRDLRKLVEAGVLAVPGYPAAIDDPLERMFENETSEGSPREMESRNELERVFAQACLDLVPAAGRPEVKRFLALRVTAYLRYVFAHMRSCLIGAILPGLLILVGVSTYAFQPREFVTLAVWIALALAVAVTAWVFVQMDRNATLSRIGDTQPGQVSFDRAFFTNLLTYVGVPVLGLVAAQFPEVGRLLGRLMGQLLRITGGG